MSFLSSRDEDDLQGNLGSHTAGQKCLHQPGSRESAVEQGSRVPGPGSALEKGLPAAQPPSAAKPDNVTSLSAVFILGAHLPAVTCPASIAELRLDFSSLMHSLPWA